MCSVINTVCTLSVCQQYLSAMYTLCTSCYGVSLQQYSLPSVLSVHLMYILLWCVSAMLCLLTQPAPCAQPPCRRVGDEPQLFQRAPCARPPCRRVGDEPQLFQRAPFARPPCRRVGDEPQLFLIQATFGHSSWSSSSSSNDSAVSYLAVCFSTTQVWHRAAGSPSYPRSSSRTFRSSSNVFTFSSRLLRRPVASRACSC
jgi:hypothetical protein